MQSLLPFNRTSWRRSCRHAKQCPKDAHRLRAQVFRCVASVQQVPVGATRASPSAVGRPGEELPADSWYTKNIAIPRHVDSVKVAMLEGKGRGLVATRDIALGELVMATPPLVLVTSPQRQRPSGELVVDEILERRLYSSKWFSVLYDGSSRSCKSQLELAPDADAAAPAAAAAEAEASGSSPAAASASSSEAADAPRSARPPEPILASTSAPSPAAATAAPAEKKKGFLASRGPAMRRGKGSAAAGAAGDLGAAAAQLPLPDRREQTRLAKVVKFNCFGDDAEDLAACECRGEQPRGHIGLWPEFALFNHSCAPNTINYVVGEAMVVRASRHIKAGEEVTICYLGRPQLLPVSRRISILAEDYGFECSCARCTAEQAHYDKVEDVYMELFEAVTEQLGPAFLEARAAADEEGVREVQRQVQAWLRRLYGLFRKTLLAPDVRQYVLASLYDAYDLLLSCADALGQGEDASSLQASLKAIEAVSAGSDLHVLLAIRHFDETVRQHGPDSPLAELARQALRRAHVARYGPVSEGMMARLVDLNRKLHVESSS
ncbi:hypothetical protein PLESTB_000206400 [Pleodorina starrii]|uniref:SET domain-containing protein n=1 Tax=Pleodorina starrii TaxID=330485 RepID=A0A9W6EYJ8_9CHLO|nr:hypothetical protein PLESTM_000325100 [Pleodorina starrii]GLC49320.1 hypothetical protein PLESTB_000206400 [Pleodorina starrii]GLC73423.1 hypothetical protein PLESTF_001373800 [Pleodorina starrii]